MNNDVVFVKTDAGRQEMQDRALKLAAALRAVLLMVDGRRDLSQLRGLAAGLHAPHDAIEQLVAIGLIQTADGSQALAPRDLPAAGAPAYGQLYRLMSEAVREHLGLKGYFIQLKVERCANVEELGALLPEMATAITKAKGHTFATAWLARMHEDARV